MLKESTLELLRNQKEESFKFTGIDKLELTNELLANIGDPDFETRDRLIYPCLAHLLYDKHFSEEELSSFFDVLTDENHLFYDIENDLLNSVLTRSFSSLQIVILLYVHKRDGIIDPKKIKAAFDKYLLYFEKEVHYEGYNEEVGWLHSMAHAADVFNQFFTIEYFTENEMKQAFDLIGQKFKQRHYYFIHDEDERLVIGMSKAIKRNLLSEEFLLNWIEAFSIYEKDGRYPEMYYITKNVRNLLRALYFSFFEEPEYKFLTDKIIDVLKRNVTLR